MRRILITLVMLLFFTTNQAAMAFEQCKDAGCITGSLDVQKQAEHQKQDPCCPTHCAISGHHAIAMPENPSVIAQAMTTDSPHWGLALMPESTTLEGLIEPPSLA